MNKLVEQTVNKYSLISNGDKIIVALSGGADSVSLLNILISLKEKYNLTIYAAHINHGLRGDEADRDENFCKNLCKKYNVKLFVKKADVKALSKNLKISEELCGRNVRYAYFNELSAKLGAKIATAHTASDNAETLLFNIARGTSIGGLGAIPPKRDNIIRPLIELTRFDIELYCKKNNLEYVTDSSNLEDVYTRNNIRHNIIPVFKQINPAFEKSAIRLCESARDIVSYIDSVASAKLEECTTDYGYDCKKLASLDKAVFKQAVIILCKKYKINVEQRHILLLCEIIKNGGSLELSKKYTAVSKQGILRITSNKDIDAFHPIKFKNNLCFSYNGKNYSVKEIYKDNFIKSDINLVTSDIVNQNPIFRNRREGDKFTYPERKVTKPLRKVLNEQKIPSELRDSLIVLACDSTILWCEKIGASLQGKACDANFAIKIEVY